MTDEIGAKNRRITIWANSGAVDGANEPVADPWVLHATKWASVKAPTGMATIRAAAQSDGINTPLDRYSYRIDYDRSILVSMQVRDLDGDRLAVIAVTHDKANKEYTDIVCEYGGANE